MKRIIQASLELSKGIFWVKDINNISDTMIYFDIPCDTEGNSTNDDFISNAKSGTTYNHENTWKELPSFLTDNKSFNYYPRGRVEISHGNATIYCSPYLATEELVQVVKNKFNLNSHNGIKDIKIKADGSSHYRCYLDRI